MQRFMIKIISRYYELLNSIYNDQSNLKSPLGGEDLKDCTVPGAFGMQELPFGNSARKTSALGWELAVLASLQLRSVNKREMNKRIPIQN